jgi:hypothetical protein
VSTHTIDVIVEDGNDATMVTLSGLATPAGIHALLMELDGLAQQGAALRLLLDETDLTAGLMGLGDIHDIVGDWRKASALKSRRIAVVATNPLIRGLNQVFRIVANVENRDSVRAFSNRSDALAWLGRPLAVEPSR